MLNCLCIKGEARVHLINANLALSKNVKDK